MSFIGQYERMAKLLEFIHSDVCSPIGVAILVDLSTLTDDLSRYGYIYLMRKKHEIFEEGSKIFSTK